MKLSRREVVQAAAALGLWGCGGPGAGTGGSEDAGQDGDGVQQCSRIGAFDISDNHGHDLSLSRQTLEASAGGVFDIRASATHAHSVTLTSEQVTALLAGETVSVDSDVASEHHHTVQLRCGGTLPDDDTGIDYGMREQQRL